MAAKKSQNPQENKEKVVKAALDLAAQQGWDYTSLRDIARAAEVDFADLRLMFDEKSDILAALGRMLDYRVLQEAGEAQEDVSPRDRLFDLLMERFDALGDYREGVCAVLEDFKYDPKQAVIALPHLCKSMNWMLEAAGIETAGIKGALKLAGLTGLYLKVLRVWKDDESVDLAKTMAALDKGLGRAEGWAETLGF